MEISGKIWEISIMSDVSVSTSSTHFSTPGIEIIKLYCNFRLILGLRQFYALQFCAKDATLKMHLTFHHMPFWWRCLPVIFTSFLFILTKWYCDHWSVYWEKNGIRIWITEKKLDDVSHNTGVKDPQKEQEDG